MNPRVLTLLALGVTGLGCAKRSTYDPRLVGAWSAGPDAIILIDAGKWCMMREGDMPRINGYRATKGSLYIEGHDEEGPSWGKPVAYQVSDNGNRLVLAKDGFVVHVKEYIRLPSSWIRDAARHATPQTK